jgi:hypothetical protein
MAERLTIRELERLAESLHSNALDPYGGEEDWEDDPGIRADADLYYKCLRIVRAARERKKA